MLGAFIVQWKHTTAQYTAITPALRASSGILRERPALNLASSGVLDIDVDVAHNDLTISGPTTSPLQMRKWTLTVVPVSIMNPKNEQHEPRIKHHAIQIHSTELCSVPSKYRTIRSNTPDRSAFVHSTN